MKVMVSYPPLRSEKGFPLLSQNRQFQWFNNPTLIFPLIPASAATLLKSKGFEVAWLDGIAERMSYDDYVERLRVEKPDLVAIETKTPVIKAHWKIIEDLKNELPDTKFVLMGDHVTSFPEESMENCLGLDFVITGGDYDFMLLEVCEHLKDKKALPKGVWYRKGSKIRNTGVFDLCNDLNELPMTDRELTRSHLYNLEFNFKEKPFAYTMAGRDCPYHQCRFCAWPVLFPKFRTRSPESLLDEIGMLIEKYGVKEVFDDTGTFPPGEWLREFCKGMIERGYNKKIRFSCNMRVNYMNMKDAVLMRKAGFRLLKIGLESANQETLDRINKGVKVEQITEACEIAKKVGLEMHLTMIVGYPWETREKAMNTVRFAKRLMSKGLATVLQSTVLVPYPGTPIWKEAVEEEWFRFDPYDYERYDMSEPVLVSANMKPEEVKALCNSIYSSFLTPGYVARRFTEIRSFRDVKYLARGFKAVLGHKKDFSRGD